MEQTYTLRAGDPGDTLNVSIANEQDGERIHDAGLSLRRREMTRAAMSRVLIRHPASAMLTLARIYAHGLKLKLKGVPHYRNPRERLQGLSPHRLNSPLRRQRVAARAKRSCDEGESVLGVRCLQAPSVTLPCRWWAWWGPARGRRSLR